MKQFIFLIVLISILSCTKETEAEKEGKKYYSYAEVNGSEWKGLYSFISNKQKGSDSLYIGLKVFNDLGYGVEDLAFINIPKTQDTVFLKTVQIVSKTIAHAYLTYFTSDGDAVKGTYIVAENAKTKNWILVKKVNETDYSGTFNLNMVYLKGNKKDGADTLHFAKGSFLAKWRII